MSRSARKFSSPQEMKEEILPPAESSKRNPWPGKERHSSFHGGHSPERSDWEANDALKSKDPSGWPSWEFPQGDRDMQKDDTINRGGLKISTSPTFNGQGYQKYSRSPDNSQNLPFRGRGRGRDRKRSRSRGRDRKRSRSRSRDRGWSRSPRESRGRGGSRSWDRGRSRSQSRSPFHDFRRESYGLTDKRSGSGMTSKPCRDFAVGKCRRGSQCRFFHQDNLNYKDDARSENDLAERWRSRPDHGGFAKYGENKESAVYPRDKISDGHGKYYDDETLRDSRKDTLCCKDFLKGTCHREASCRYPHHSAAGDDYDRGNKKAFYDQDVKRLGNRSGKIPCKYFAMGKCHRDDCRFSHDGPASGNLDGRSHDDKRGHNLDDKNKSWNCPTWDDAAGFPDTAKATGWGADKKKSWNGPTWDDVAGFSDRPKATGWCDSSVKNTSSHDPTAADKQTDEKWGHSLENERKARGGPEWTEKAAEREEFLSPSWQNDSNWRSHDGRWGHSLDDKKKSRNGPTWDAAVGFPDTTKGTGWGKDKKNSWNGPTWDDIAGPLDRPKATGWGESSVKSTNSHDPMAADKQTYTNTIKAKGRREDKKKSWDDVAGSVDRPKANGCGDSSVGNMNSHDPTAAEKQTDDIWGHSLETKRKARAGPGWNEKAAERDEYLSSHWRNGSNGADKGTTEFMDSKMLIDGEEHQNDAQGSELQTLDGISAHVHEQNIMQESSARQLANTGMLPKIPEDSYIQQHQGQGGDSIVIADAFSAVNLLQVSGNDTHQVLVQGQSFNLPGDSLGSQPPSSLSGTDQSCNALSLNPSNGLTIDLARSVQHKLSTLDPQNQTRIHFKEAVKIPEMVEFRVPQITPDICHNIVPSEQVAQLSNLPASLTQISQNGQQLPPLYRVVNPPDTTGLVHSLFNSELVLPPIDLMGDHPNPATRSQEQYDLIRDGMDPGKPGNSNKPSEFLFNSVEQENEMTLKRLPLLSTGNPNSSKVRESGVLEEESQESSMLKQQEPVPNPEDGSYEKVAKVNRNNDKLGENCKQEQENIHSGSVDAHCKVENQDEKAMRLFKVVLVEFVKEILKPTWKQGQMSKEVHKTIVKKVIDKVSSTIQGVQIPKTQEHIDQYLSVSKPKISKLVQAYVERFQKS